MKILYLAHRIPYPPNKGDKIRSFHELEYFSRCHEIHLLTFCDQPGDKIYEKELRGYCRQVTLVPIHPLLQKLRAAISMLLGKPWTLGYFTNLQMRKAMHKAIRENSFDLVFAFSSSMAQYARSLKGMPRILDFVDSDASKWRKYAEMRSAPSKWLYGFEGRNLRKYEAEAISDSDFSIFVSKREIEHLSEHVDLEKLRFIQNGVDLDFFPADRQSRSNKSIIFAGAMDYFPNANAVIFFAREVLPIVRRVIPYVKFLIVGSNPTRQVRSLGNLPGVIVTGTVKDVRPYLAQADVAVVPIRISQGIQNKILEALASGLPVVATRAALDGMAFTKDLPVAEADDPRSFAEHVVGFLNNPITNTQVEKCRRLLQANFDWNTNLSVYDSLFARLVSSHSTA